MSRFSTGDKRWETISELVVPYSQAQSLVAAPCRCTAYCKIVQAIKKATGKLSSSE